MSSSTIYDIAQAANVSIATVSRVFNNSSNVSPKTKKKILDIAQGFGYHPKAFAQGLARKNSKMLMILVPVISNYFFMEVLAGVQDKLLEYDYDLSIYNLNQNQAERNLKDQVEYVMSRGMADGYLMVSVHQKQVQWEQLKGYDKPIILIDEYNPNHDSVSSDSVEGSYLATKHFIDQGYERIALISANPHSKPMLDRRTGYKRAIEDSGRMVNEDYIFISDDLYRDGFSEENGYESMKRIIRDFPSIEAVVCASDIQALGALKAMKDAAVRYPIIGFDDIPISRYLGLSTMKQPMYEMGTLALEKLLHRIQHPDSMISHTVFSPELVVRETSLSVQITH